MLNEVQAIRNHWAHNTAILTEDALRAIDSIYRLLKAVGATEVALKLEEQRLELMHLQLKEQGKIIESDIPDNVNLKSSPTLLTVIPAATKILFNFSVFDDGFPGEWNNKTKWVKRINGVNRTQEKGFSLVGPFVHFEGGRQQIEPGIFLIKDLISDGVRTPKKKRGCTLDLRPPVIVTKSRYRLFKIISAENYNLLYDYVGDAKDWAYDFVGLVELFGDELALLQT